MISQTEPTQSPSGLQLSDDLQAHEALQQSQFVPFFQPIITLRTGQLAGFEVLARWNHPTKGIISPDKFIGLAESGGWIAELTWQIMEKAFAAAAAIPDDLTLSINISPVHLRDPRLPEVVRDIADSVGFALSRLIIEITESALIDNLESARAIVAELKAMGCRLALDDFGTGYSSLHHLQSLPFDELKVDRSFVSSMTTKRESRKIVAAVVGLGQSLGLINVAEGIETQEQAEMMMWLGCELGQGYLFSRPIPEAELAASILATRPQILARSASPWKKISAGNMDVSPSQRLAQLQAVYDGAPVGLAFVDQKLTYMNLNKRLADMNGGTVEGHLGMKVSDMIPDLFPHVEPYIRRALSGEANLDIEVKLAESGETRCISYQPALDEAGEVVGVSLAVSDITGRKRIDEALKESEAHYRSMVELNPQVLWIMDPQGRNLDISPRWDKTTGLLMPQSADHDWLNSVHPEDIQPTIRAIAEFRRTGEPIDVEYRVESGDDTWHWKRSLGSPRFDANGNIVCWYGSVQDIESPGTNKNHKPELVSEVKAGLAEELHVTGGPAELEGSKTRHQVLSDLEILDTPAESEFDDLVTLASELCVVPISMVSLVDLDRQWFKASVGIASSENPISHSFCAHAIEQEGIMVVEDATKDSRFEQNPLVTCDPYIRFYAGVPVHVHKVAIGTLCVIDTVPRSLSPEQTKALIILAQQVQARLELRSERKQLNRALKENWQLTRNLDGGRKATLCA